jgi:glyoxylase-like metal-dependent hydrolase (beta-lactamase superfamily II)
MNRISQPVIGVTLAVSLALSASAYGQSLQGAAKALNVAGTKSIEVSGTGKWFQFGQAPNDKSPWPQFDVSRFVTDINFETPAARVQIARSQTVEPGRSRPAPVEQKVDQYVSASYAWNIPVATSATPNAATTPSAQPAVLEERNAEIWATPQGFLKAAGANAATTRSVTGGIEVSFAVGGKYRYLGIINGKNQVERVQTWIDSPVLGDTLVETRFSEYKDFGGIQFPAHIVRNLGGYPILDIKVAEVKLNPEVDIAVPPEVANAKPPVVTVAVNKLAEGVFYLTGGTHHSVAIEQRDHIVLIEAPQNEARSQALIAKLKEIIPNKPIKFVVNTHAHFDHSGGLRTFVDEGATIVTEQANRDYYEKIWAAPHTLNPDQLAKSKKVARFDVYTGKHVLSDGNRAIEIFSIAGSGHNDAFDLVYLPGEKLLVEADAYTPTAANAPPPTSVNPYSANLYENIQKLHLDVNQIAALHGPRLVTLADLRTVIAVNTAAK